MPLGGVPGGVRPGPHNHPGIANGARSSVLGSWPPGFAHWHTGLQECLADRLGIDLELFSDRGAGESQRVQRHGSFNVVRGQHPPSSGHPVAFEKSQDSCPVNRVLAGQGECRRSGQVASDELIDLLGWEPALNLSRAIGLNTTALDRCTVSGLTEDMVVELPDGCSDPRIDQIRPCDTAQIPHFPW